MLHFTDQRHYVQGHVCTLAVILVFLSSIPTAAEEITIGTQAGEHVMVRIPAGEFTMSSGESAHSVTLDSFYIDKYEVSNALYNRFVEATGHQRREISTNAGFSAPDLPAIGASWFDANDYCTWVGLRLPTEAEWERAAGAGDGRMYPWGNDPSTPQLPRANFGRLECFVDCKAVGDDSDGYLYVAPVNSFPEGASPFGVVNMLGNAGEWVFDWYGPLPLEAQVNPVGPSEGVDKVVKGGSWNTWLPDAETIGYRGSPPAGATDSFGLRCAKDAKAVLTAVRSEGWGAVKGE